MSKQKQNKTMSVSAYQYELERIPLDAYPRIFGALLASEQWHKLMDRRNSFVRMFRSFRPGTSEAVRAFKEVEKIDDTAGKAVLSTLVNCYLQMESKDAKRKVTLAEFKDDFVKTPEQEEIYDAFNRRLDMSNFLVDTVDSVVSDAKGFLQKLDPQAMLTEFDSVKQMQRLLQDFSYARHNNEHPEFFECFEKYSDEITHFAMLKAAQFNKECQEIRQRLIATGKLKEGSNQVKEDLY